MSSRLPTPQVAPLLDLLLIPVMTGHLLAVGLAGSLPFVCIWLEWRESRRGDELAGRLGRQLARHSLAWLTLGIGLGLLSVFLAWRQAESSYFAAWEFIPRSRFEFGVAELAFFYVFMFWYLRSWGRFRQPIWHRLIAVLAATDLLYHFPPLFAAIAALAARPELRGTRFVHLLVDPEVFTRTLHHWLASLALCAGYTCWCVQRLPDLGSHSESATRLKKGAARLALAAACLQLPVGFALVVLLPDVERGPLLGGDWLAAGLMAAGLFTALGLLHHLAAIAFGGGDAGEVRRALLLVVLTFLFMVAARQSARRPLSLIPPTSSLIPSPAPMPKIITLSHPSGSSARVHAGFGFNCFSFQAIHDGQPTEIFWSAPDFESGSQRASGSGNPILFPFAGRITGGKFEFEGRSFQLEAGDGRGNAIHGFVISRPWRVTDQSESSVTAEFQASVDAPELLKLWPADFHIRGTYELAGNTLHNRFVIRNPGQSRLPFGLGTHPYFRLPLGTKGSADECVVTVPIRESWELVDLLPTGKKLHSEIHDKVAAGIPFGETKFDDVFTGLQPAGGQVTAWIHDAANGRALRVLFDDSFRECVVYNPPHRQAICIEPYTCVPDAFLLSARGQETGLRVLDPGEEFSAAIAITLE